MRYRHTIDRNFEDFASGRVFYTLPGQPAFPVRLASEIFQRCLVHWQKMGGEGLCTVYDPTCGGAYWLVALAYLHWDRVSAIYASDVDAEVITLAKRNLSLLTTQGLHKRIAEIEAMFSAYGKESHAGALESANRFHRQLKQYLKSHTIHTHVFLADGMEPQPIQQGTHDSHIDILIADVPYGWHSTWQETADNKPHSPIWRMLDALRPVLSPESVIAIAADKRQVIRHDGYQRLERFQVGKRQIALLGLKAK
jgi:hypothetical protein